MKRFLASCIILILGSVATAQSYSHNYESFFGNDDRIDLYSEEARLRISEIGLKSIRDNTILMDCGTSGKPSTAFVAKTYNGPRIFSAAHNLTMAENNNLNCTSGNVTLRKGTASSAFIDSGTLKDAAHDIAQWPNITASLGFKICETLDLSSRYILVQSLDGNGQLGLSPFCKIKSVKNQLITTTCRGHYKASGSPLLSVKGDNICVAGVFNAHSGKRFNYESYAARLEPHASF